MPYTERYVLLLVVKGNTFFKRGEKKEALWFLIALVVGVKKQSIIYGGYYFSISINRLPCRAWPPQYRPRVVATLCTFFQDLWR